ncbi:Ff.00g061750.m01.CDS01 [Fusarium sp. VM40]|nr:Ff.00g061750.m01.CDS01 [Fusarium sp. VM40]
MPPLVRRHPPSISRRQTPWFVRGKLYAAGFMSLWIMPHLPRPVSPITGWRNLSRSQLQQGFVFIIFADNVTASMLELSAHVFEGASVQVMVEEHEDADGVKVQWLMYPEGYDVDSIPDYY